MGYFKDWWKSLFSDSGETDELGFPTLKRENITPMSEVKPCKPQKNISEPVLSFIEVYKANPKRFKVFTLWSEYENEYGKKEFLGYELKDTQVNKTFSLSAIYVGCTVVKSAERGMGDEYHWNYAYRAIKNTSWMTTEERELVVTVVEKERTERAKSLLAKKETMTRERLTKLYKGE